MPGGPQSLYNILSGIPKENYAILTSGRNIEKCLRGAIKGNWLGCDYYYYDFVPQEIETYELKKNIFITDIRNKIVKAIKAVPFIGTTFYDSCVSIHTIFSFYRAAIKCAKGVKARALLGLSDKGPALIATWLAARRLGLPYNIYLFDIYKGNNLNFFEALLARLLERRILEDADTLLLTNEGTEDYYHRRYGTKISTLVVHNSTFPRLSPGQLNPYNPKPPYKIVFTGHVEWPQEQSIMNLITAMKLLHDLPVILELYVPEPSRILLKATANQKNIILSKARPEGMPQIQNSATLLFLPLSWDTKAPDIIATATPGKFTDYLASGRPMLIHAPAYAYISQFGRQHNIGLVVDQNDPKQLAQTIREYLDGPTRGSTYITNALQVFAQNHGAEVNSMKLAKILNVV